MNDLGCSQKPLLEIELRVLSQRRDSLSQGKKSLMVWAKFFVQDELAALKCYHNV